jgi:hypothetical protein
MLNVPSLRFVLPVFLLLAACSEPPKTETAKEPAKPPEALTGRQAFQRMYPQARLWAPDAQPLRVRNLSLTEVKAEKGKAGAWEATFVSVSKRKSRIFTYSAVEAEGNLHQGVFGGLEDSYSGSGGSASQPFEIVALKTDSDQSFDAAVAMSADYIKKNPDKPVSFLLELNPKRHPDPTWRVYWGESISTSDYSVFVDATTGKVVERSH